MMNEPPGTPSMSGGIAKGGTADAAGAADAAAGVGAAAELEALGEEEGGKATEGADEALGPEVLADIGREVSAHAASALQNRATAITVRRGVRIRCCVRSDLRTGKVSSLTLAKRRQLDQRATHP